MSILHKMEAKEEGKGQNAAGMFVPNSWQIKPDVAYALLRVVRACLCTGTWLGMSASVKSGGIKLSVRNKGIGADEWYDTASALHELAQEIEGMVDPPSLRSKFAGLPEATPPKDFRRIKVGSVEEYELVL